MGVLILVRGLGSLVLGTLVLVLKVILGFFGGFGKRFERIADFGEEGEFGGNIGFCVCSGGLWVGFGVGFRF